MNSASVLISCGGIGMGNASRVMAVVQSLHAIATKNNIRLTCIVVSWGSGYRFLEEYKRRGSVQFELHALRTYRHFRFSFLRFPFAYIANILSLWKLVRHAKPGAVLLDSDYHFPAFWLSKCPLFFIGQANDIVDRAHENRYQPRSVKEWFNWLFREKLDSWIQNLMADKVFVPSFNPDSGGDSCCLKVPLIVREDFQNHPLHHPEQPAVGLLLSGSETEKKPFLTLSQEHNLIAISPANANGHPVISSPEMLDRLDVVLVQGGLSSISECIARRRFMAVFPIKDHPEQILNAFEVQRLGLGIACTLTDLQDFSSLLKKIREKRTLQPAINISCNGSEHVAQFILNQLHFSA